MQLGWIDFSKEDRQKAFDVINLLSEQGAVDELGIGVIRDAFANYFFPGTSTIQTRAKYFLIVPYMLREAVDGRYGKDANRVLRAIDSAGKLWHQIVRSRSQGRRCYWKSCIAKGLGGKKTIRYLLEWNSYLWNIL